MTPFVALSLPRSRSFWTSRFLSDDARPCAHDPARFFSSRDDVIRYFAKDSSAAADTGLGLIWSDLAPLLRQDLRVAVLHRPCSQVMKSLVKVGIPNLPSVRSRLSTMARVLVRVRGAHFHVQDLDTEDGAKRLFEFCTARPFDAERWRALRRLNLQCDIAAYRRDMTDNAAGLRTLFDNRRATA